MKKSALSMAVIAALGVSYNASAGIVLNVLPDAQSFIKETLIDDVTGTSVTAPAVSHRIGIQLSSGKAYYVRYKVVGTGAAFTGAAAGDLQLCPRTGATPTPAAAISTAGCVSLASNVDTFTDATGTALVFSVSTGTTSWAQYDFIRLINVGVSTTSESAVSLEYGLYDLQGPANSGDSTSFAHLGGQTAPYFNFNTSGYTSGSAIPRIPNINVSTGSINFEAPSASEMGTTNSVPVCAFNLYPTNNTWLIEGSMNTTSQGWFSWLDSYTLTLEGDFSATSNVWLDSDPACSNLSSTASFSPNTTDGTFEFMTGSYTPAWITNADPTGMVYVCMGVDGVTPITPSPYALSFSGAAGTWANVAGHYEDPNPTSGLAFDCAETSKGGSSQSIPLVLNASSAWKQYIRVTNPSNISGNVFLVMYDDAGNQAGTTPSFSLNPGESTGLMFVGDIMAAAGISPTNDSGPENTAVKGGTRNKTRLVVEAEFGNPDLGTGVQARSYVLPAGDPATEWGGSTFTQFD